jgi:hypothetical protein
MQRFLIALAGSFDISFIYMSYCHIITHVYMMFDIYIRMQ